MPTKKKRERGVRQTRRKTEVIPKSESITADTKLKQSVRRGGTTPPPLRTDFTKDDVRGRGPEALHAAGLAAKNVLVNAPISAAKAIGTELYYAPREIGQSLYRTGESATRKMKTVMVVPKKVAEGTAARVAKAAINTTRRLTGNTVIQLRGTELEKAVANFKAVPVNDLAKYHYYDTLSNSRIRLADRVEKTWGYHKDVIRNVLNRGHAVLLQGANKVRPPGMDETAWKKWLTDPLHPERTKWLNTINSNPDNSVRAQKYYTIGVDLTHVEKQTDNIQSFFQFLDKVYDAPEPEEKKPDPLTDITNLEPAPTGTSSVSGGGALPPYDTASFVQTAGQYDIAFQGISKKRFSLKYLVSKDLALESVLERFGMPKDTDQTNFSNATASPLLQSMKTVLFYPDATEATPQEEREYGSDILATVSTALQDEFNNIPNEKTGFLPDLEVESTSDMMPKFIFRRYLPGQKLPPYPGQKPHLTIKDNMMELAV